MADDRLPLFAFGTLRRGEENHSLLAGRYDRVLRASLPGYVSIEPLMIDRSAGYAVPGELFFLRDDVYAAALADCDRLEEIPPGELSGRWYERRRVRVETADGSFDAWAYVRPRRTTRPRANDAGT